MEDKFDNIVAVKFSYLVKTILGFHEKIHKKNFYGINI